LHGTLFVLLFVTGQRGIVLLTQGCSIGEGPMNDHEPTLATLDPDILVCLDTVIDPEIGLSIVELGLVYRAARTPEGIQVSITLTTRACPIGEMILDDIRERLAARFQDVNRIDVNLVWEPLWHPGRISSRGLKRLRNPRGEVA
jgi:metal-sulfur cluster biosynthetic enzyme